jgi:hypothetical protein
VLSRFWQATDQVLIKTDDCTDFIEEICFIRTFHPARIFSVGDQLYDIATAITRMF